jgi:hypothetical protein
VGGIQRGSASMSIPRGFVEGRRLWPLTSPDSPTGLLPHTSSGPPPRPLTSADVPSSEPNAPLPTATATATLPRNAGYVGSSGQAISHRFPSGSAT